jgi:hypothetical protein
VCASCASTGLCGGPRVIAVPTATSSYDGGVMSSQEAVHVSPYGGNTGRGRRSSGHLAVSVSVRWPA